MGKVKSVKRNPDVRLFFRKAVLGCVAFFLLLTLSTISPNSVSAQESSFDLGTESILDWQSDIVINEDSTLDVTETIKVNALLIEIKHGIYRDFPTVYRDSFGFVESLDFVVSSVTRDGYPEIFTYEAQPNGMRVYIGDPNQYITVGEHVYVISYHTTEQLGYFENHDELFYNVTGNGWVFPIDVARASIRLPQGVSETNIAVGGYTGLKGSREGLYSSATSTESGIVIVDFVTTAGLNPQEGFTIYVDWPKGIVNKPSMSAQMLDFVHDNIPTFVGVFFAFGVLLYYFGVWFLFGRDPSGSAIYPRYEISPSLSPAKARLLKVMAADTKAMTASLVNMAVKGYLKINETKKFLSTLFSVERLKKADALLSDEEGILDSNLFGPLESFVFSNSSYAEVKRIIDTFEKSLNEYGTGKVKRNGWYTAVGILIAAVGLLAIVISGLVVYGSEHGSSLIAVALFAGIGCLVVVILVQSILRGRSANKLGCALQIGCLLPFILAVFVMMLFGMRDLFVGSISLYEVAASVFLVVVHFLFSRALMARTPEGRLLYEEVAGLEMFIRATEEEKLKRFGGKMPLTFSTYEKFLPYAIALDLEQVWASQFSQQIKAALADPNTYPGWYSGPSFSSSGFTSSMSSSFSSTISSSSAPPGSSSGGSGGGGGGGSGGGGGGGGGGGW